MVAGEFSLATRLASSQARCHGGVEAAEKVLG
jgi:hypothetical protein